MDEELMKLRALEERFDSLDINEKIECLKLYSRLSQYYGWYNVEPDEERELVNSGRNYKRKTDRPYVKRKELNYE